MSKKFLFAIFALFSATQCVQSETMGGRAYTRFPQCRAHDDKDDANVKDITKDIIPMSTPQQTKVMGNIGIVGGYSETFAGLYFMGMAALRVGADEVHIYCNPSSANPMRTLSPDFVIHPWVDIDHNKLVAHIIQMNVIVLGHGLDLNQNGINVINIVLSHAKTHKKPLVIDLDEYFYTPAFLNSIFNYPEPGVVIMANQKEFEKIYAHIKAKDAYGDAQINIDFNRVGPNILIYRKGCTDMAFAKNPSIAWAYSADASHRRSVGQGCIITGAAATYYHWALSTIGKNNNGKDVLLPASVATYSAAKLMRKLNKIAVQESRSALTSDMMNIIGTVLYGNDME